MVVTEREKPQLMAYSGRYRANWAVLVPAMTFLGVRAIGVGLLAVFSAIHDYSLLDRLTAWDGVWYLRIAAHGYSLGFFIDAHGEENAFTPRAFFPAYPLATRAVATVTTLDLTAAAFVVTTACGLVAAYGVARLGRLVRDGSPRAGTILVALFAAAPMSIALSMAYTETMFCALAAWGLVGVLERRWWLAGTCAALAGLVRSSALALVVAVTVPALVSAVRRRRWQPLVALVLAPTGLVGYLWWTGVQVRPRAGLFTQLWTWPDLEWQGWATRFDWGVATLRFVGQVLAGQGYVMSFLAVAVILGSVVLLTVGIRRRVEWPLLVYGGMIMLLALGSSGLMHSKPRLLLPAAITLVLPPALGLAKRRTSTVVPLLIASALAGGWFGAYALTVWKYAV
jgi:hypothetical protein